MSLPQCILRFLISSYHFIVKRFQVRKGIGVIPSKKKVYGPELAEKETALDRNVSKMKGSQCIFLVYRALQLSTVSLCLIRSQCTELLI